MGIMHTDRSCLFIHHLDETTIRAAHRLCDRHSRIIPGDQHHPIQQLVKRERHIRPKTDVRAILRHRTRRDHRILGELRLALFERNDTGQDLRRTCRIDTQTPFLIRQHLSRIPIDQRSRDCLRRRRRHDHRRRGRRRCHPDKHAQPAAANNKQQK